jgi:hypothetical protein
MSKIEEIERAVQQPTSEDLAEFRAWFVRFDADVWDRQFEEDVKSGRLDVFAQEALEDRREGRCTEL